MEVEVKQDRDFGDINWSVHGYVNDAHGHHVVESHHGYKTSAPDSEELLLEKK